MSAPRLSAAVEPVPHGRTARRLEWTMLPPPLRALVEQRLGSAVVSAQSAGAGFTPGFASVLTGEDGRTLFVKAANKVAQRPFAASYAEEARKLHALPAGLPAPRLLWTHEDERWVVLGLEHVAGRNPGRPWLRRELDACLDTLETLADALTPPPAGMRLRPLVEELDDMRGCWEQVRAVCPDRPHLAEAAALAASFGPATEGDTLVHTDARDDNFVLDGAGRALLCDWNWPAVGAAWVDTVLLLISAYGDGLDADAVLAERRLTRDVACDDVDALLALVTGYFLRQREEPAPSSSPYLRVHQAWYAAAGWGWLAARRGWT